MGYGGELNRRSHGVNLSGDRRSEFPQPVAPFPEPVDLTPALDSATLPLQKLRPIRRSPPEDRPSFSREQIEYFDGGSAAAGVAELVESDAAVAAAAAAAMEAEEESLGPKSEWCGFTGLDLEDEYSSSSDNESEGDLLADDKEGGDQKRKRKRKTREKMEFFMESLVMKIMDKQEEMNKQLIDMIEKREKERVIREEAWKQQEMERMRRDEEMRVQENSRSVALISFIQNVLGQDIQIPQSWTTVSSVEGNGGKDGESHIEKDIMYNQDNRKWQEVRDPNKRWPEAEVQALIMLRTALQQKFRIAGSKCPIWDEISVGMHKMGYDRSGKKCKEKWENINKYFRKSMGNGKKHKENSKACRYFHDLDNLYKNGLVSPGNASNFTDYEIVGNASDLANYEIIAENERE